MVRKTLLAGSFVLSVATLVAAEPASSGLVQELERVMVAAKMDAIAATDPTDADRFVAALLFPDSQLLLVSARYAAPAVLAQQLERREYRDIYMALNGAAIPESKFFVQDMGADGLHREPGETVDVVYEKVVNQTIFNGRPSEGTTAKAYAANSRRPMSATVSC